MTNKQALVVKTLASNPHITLAEAADRCGVSRAYISKIRTNFKLEPGRPKAPGELSIALKAALRHQPKLKNWLDNNCPPSVELAAFIIAILVDVMEEEIQAARE